MDMESNQSGKGHVCNEENQLKMTCNARRLEVCSTCDLPGAACLPTGPLGKVESFCLWDPPRMEAEMCANPAIPVRKRSELCFASLS